MRLLLFFLFAGLLAALALLTLICSTAAALPFPLLACLPAFGANKLNNDVMDDDIPIRMNIYACTGRPGMQDVRKLDGIRFSGFLKY